MNDDEIAVCSSCGGTALPFGKMRQWFALDESGALCLECAKRLVPERVAIAEAWEARWSDDANGSTENE